ncbi:MAG: alpha-hydroxy-acid oxidizing protein [Hyphomicrobiaceae bacterium]|nr:MAG: alpha-hydroxy-acid oxidizing protein [Hyphomicrobiaceae bacterium]
MDHGDAGPRVRLLISPSAGLGRAATGRLARRARCRTYSSQVPRLCDTRSCRHAPGHEFVRDPDLAGLVVGIRALNIDDLRRLARRRLPRGIFEYIDRGAEDEIGLKRLRQAFDAVIWNPRVLVDVSEVNLSTTVLGKELPLPIAVAPTAAAGLVWHEGEIALARAAARAQIPFCIATESITEMERITAEAGGQAWFQLYLWKDRALSYALVERARAAGIETLILTADTVVSPNREYNVRNGFAVPIRASLRGGYDILTHPRWVLNVLLKYARSGGMPLCQHYPPEHRVKITRQKASERVKLAADIRWDELEKLRRLWRGKLILKGVLHPEDAKKAADAGADAIVVSCHGARNLDGAIPPLWALPSIVEAVGSRLEVIADSGIRRGTDILKLLAMGARSVLVGRATLYGTAVAGEAGASHALDLLRKEMATALAFLGCPKVAQLDRAFVAEGRGFEERP